jgi:UDP-2,3-diacylglucosamine hydrolase
MNNIYFISDIHLDSNNKEVTNKFISFILEKSSDMKELYILGDLFEFWVDDKYDISQNNIIISTLNNLSKNGTKVFLMHGNRDFLIGKKFTEITNVKILPENYILNLEDTRVLITHGDLLCTDDIDYQKFRKFVRNKITLKIFNLLNNNIKKKIASYLRGKSKKITSQKSDNIMDVNFDTVLSFHRKFKTNIIIHGHTHRKNIHKTQDCGENYIRYVLGDWHNAPSYIIYKNNKIELLDI